LSGGTWGRHLRSLLHEGLQFERGGGPGRSHAVAGLVENCSRTFGETISLLESMSSDLWPGTAAGVFNEVEGREVKNRRSVQREICCPCGQERIRTLRDVLHVEAAR
jgi:hypothetical protein